MLRQGLGLELAKMLARLHLKVGTEVRVHWLKALAFHHPQTSTNHTYRALDLTHTHTHLQQQRI